LNIRINVTKCDVTFATKGDVLPQSPWLRNWLQHFAYWPGKKRKLRFPKLMAYARLQQH